METKKNVPIQSERLASLDVMRGFDMLWIIGGGTLIVALANATAWGWLQPIAEQMEHVKWDGFHFEDLIFPMFMFISGVAIPYAINAKVEKGENRNLLFRKIVKRGIILVLLGISMPLINSDKYGSKGIWFTGIGTILTVFSLFLLFLMILVP